MRIGTTKENPTCIFFPFHFGKGTPPTCPRPIINQTTQKPPPPLAEALPPTNPHLRCDPAAIQSHLHMPSSHRCIIPGSLPHLSGPRCQTSSSLSSVIGRLWCKTVRCMVRLAGLTYSTNRYRLLYHFSCRTVLFHPFASCSYKASSCPL